MRRRIFEMIEKAERNDRESLYYDQFMIAIILLSVVPLCFKEKENAVFLGIEIVTMLIFVLDYILRWITADFKLKGKNPFLKYPFTLFAIFDLIAILPSLSLLHSSSYLIRALCLPKYLKVLKMLRYSRGFYLMMRVLHKQKKNLLTIIYFAIGYIFFSAVVMFQVEPNTFQHFLDAVYWSALTLTTVGYGDIYPVTDIGKIVVVISSILGVAIFALPTGIITACFLSELELGHKK